MIAAPVAEPDEAEARPPGTTWKKAALAAAVVAAIAAFFLLGGPRWVNLETLRANRDRLLDLRDRHYAAMLIGAAVVYTLATAVSLPGAAAVLSLAIGFVFGPWVGTAVVVVAATAGATLAFLGARYLFADAARRRMGPRLRKLAAGFEADGLNYMLFLRLVPLFPFWLVNLAPAFTPLGTRTFVLATAVGIIPGSFAYCYLGAQLATLDSHRRAQLWLALGLLAALSLVPVVWKKFRHRPETGAAP